MFPGIAECGRKWYFLEMVGMCNRRRGFWVEGAVSYGDGVGEMSRIFVGRRGDMTEPGEATRHGFAHKWEDAAHGQRSMTRGTGDSEAGACV